MCATTMSLRMPGMASPAFASRFARARFRVRHAVAADAVEDIAKGVVCASLCALSCLEASDKKRYIAKSRAIRPLAKSWSGKRPGRAFDWFRARRIFLLIALRFLRLWGVLEACGFLGRRDS